MPLVDVSGPPSTCRMPARLCLLKRYGGRKEQAHGPVRGRGGPPLSAVAWPLPTPAAGPGCKANLPLSSLHRAVGGLTLSTALKMVSVSLTGSWHTMEPKPMYTGGGPAARNAARAGGGRYCCSCGSSRNRKPTTSMWGPQSLHTQRNQAHTLPRRAPTGGPPPRWAAPSSPDPAGRASQGERGTGQAAGLTWAWGPAKGSTHT
jgi:hypothetical protein